MALPHLLPPEPWEHGSDFHWIDPPLVSEVLCTPPWGDAAGLYGSGRSALRALLRWGRKQAGWQRVHVPDYFCQDVVAALLEELPVVLYADSPEHPQPAWSQLQLAPGDAVLWVNYFGLRATANIADLPGVALIEDHTHDPLGAAATSRADWCVASLRKTLPLPDGGVLWSPRGHDLPAPPPPLAAHEEASLSKWAAMQLKRLYLRGQPVNKDIFRALAVRSEHEFGNFAVAPITPWSAALLSLLPLAELHAARRGNVSAATAVLAGQTWVRVLEPHAAGATPFSLVLLFDTVERCASVRQSLIANRIYPAILWPLDDAHGAGLSQPSLDLSRRLLSVHADARYTPQEMRTVAEAVRACGTAFTSSAEPHLHPAQP